MNEKEMKDDCCSVGVLVEIKNRAKTTINTGLISNRCLEIGLIVLADNSISC